MGDNRGPAEAKAAQDLLMEDYRYRAESLWKNEQGGETRVNLFIGLVTLICGALVSLGTSREVHGETLRLVVLASLTAVYVLGHITLLRMLTRNAYTDECKQSLDTIRQVFKDHFDAAGVLVHYYPVRPPDTKRKGRGSVRKIGGLAHTVAAINSLLLAALAGAAVYPIGRIDLMPGDMASAYGSSAAAFVLSLVCQVAFISRREKRAKERLRVNDPTHAGGLVYKLDGGSVKYLLVRPKRNTDEWVLPKGHIDAGEGHGEAALREVLEEAGFVARLDSYIDSVRYSADGESIDAKFYLMEYRFEMTPGDGRGKVWCSYEDALGLLSHPESRHVLAVGERKRGASGA